MKRYFALMLLALSISTIGCQKAPDEARVTATAARANGLPAGAQTTPSGIQLNGLVTRDSSQQSDFQQAVGNFVEAQMDPKYLGYVSSQGAYQTGVIVGGKLELTSGQPLIIGQSNGNVSITPTSELLIAVYDKFQDQTNIGAIPPVWFKQANGYVQGNFVHVKFFDKYGSVTLEGQFDQNRATLSFNYDTQITFDGQQGDSGFMGTLSVPTCQFFRCQ